MAAIHLRPILSIPSLSFLEMGYSHSILLDVVDNALVNTQGKFFGSIYIRTLNHLPEVLSTPFLFLFLLNFAIYIFELLFPRSISMLPSDGLHFLLFFSMLGKVLHVEESILQSKSFRRIPSIPPRGKISDRHVKSHHIILFPTFLLFFGLVKTNIKADEKAISSQTKI